MEFKIGEDIVEDENKESNLKKDNSKMSLVLIIVVALIIGLGVFLILNGIFNPKIKKTTNTTTPTSETRSLTEDNVKILYQYVTYGTSDLRYDKFVKNSKVTIDDFTEEEKYYYALQFAQVEDFEFTDKLDENKNKIYSISNRKIKKYMERFFGDNVKYSTDVELKYPFSFSINDKNVGIMKYNKATASFDTIFEEEKVDEIEETLIDPYLGKLVEAYKDADGGYRLIEKVIFVKVEKQEDGKYDVTISKDFEHDNVIESMTDQTESDISKIKVDKYKDKAATITYTFKMNSRNQLYFYSSTID